MLLTFADVFVFYPAHLFSGSLVFCLFLFIELTVAGTCYRGSQFPVTTRVCGRCLLELNIKLTDIETALHSYGRCVSHCLFRVSKPNKKRNPICKKLQCVFISLLSILGKTCDYNTLKFILIFSFFEA